MCTGDIAVADATPNDFQWQRRSIGPDQAIPIYAYMMTDLRVPAEQIAVVVCTLRLHHPCIQAFPDHFHSYLLE